MTLPSSGPLSMSAINAEFGRGNNLNAYRGTAWYTDAGGSGTFSSGALSFSDFYGKRLTSPTFSFTISSNQTNANLRTLAINAGWNQSSKVVATISSGVYISSNSTGTPALTVSGSFPGGVDLINNGTIVGMGGAGGKAAYAGTAGGGGGTALSAQTSVYVVNNGIIAGGGGGGGGGGVWIVPIYNGEGDQIGATAYHGSGGGGGRSSAAANSAGGGTGSAGAPYVTANNYAGTGGAGTLSGPGSYGSRPSINHSYGGAGGDWGAAGANGTNRSGATGATGGGAGGYAVTGNGYVSWGATGTRYGAIG